MSSLSNETALRSQVNRLGWTLCIMVASTLVFSEISLLINQLLWQIGSEKLSVAVGALSDTICYLAYFLVPAWFFYAISKKKITEPIRFTPKFNRYVPLIILGSIGLVLSTAILNDWFCQLIDYQLPTEDYTQYMSDPELVALFMTMSLAPAFAEELLFRGVIYTNLRPYGRVLAILVSSVAFGLMHQNVGQFFYTTIAGIVMALAYEATGSIWTSVFIHMFNNLFAVFQTAVLYRYDNVNAAVIIYLSQAVVIFLGIMSVILLLFVHRKQQRQQLATINNDPSAGVFGAARHENEFTSDESIPFSRSMSIVMKSPAMITFTAISVAIMLLYILMFSGGGIAA